MSETRQTVYIQWIRSGIGFPRRQKEAVRSLGLRRLNQIVERPDTPPIRGLVARVSHLVQIVEPPVAFRGLALAEYGIVAVERKPVTGPAGEEPAKLAAVESVASSSAAEIASASPANPDQTAEPPAAKKTKKGKAKAEAGKPKATSKPKAKSSPSQGKKAAKGKK